MFIGHFGLGMAAKKYMPEVSLGVLFLSVQLVDLLWPFFLLMGLEVVRIEPGYTTTNPLNFVDYPITHSLLGGLLWAIAFGGISYLIKRSKKTAYFLAGGCDQPLVSRSADAQTRLGYLSGRFKVRLRHVGIAAAYDGD